MSNEVPEAAVETPPAVPTPPAIVQPDMSEERLEELRVEAKKARIVACQRDINAVLAKHRCAIRAAMDAYIGPDGVTRHRADVEVFAT